MIEIIKYFRILFMSPKISRERLKDFTESHIQRLTANNPGGIFTVILTNIAVAYTNYFGDLSSEAVNLAVQEGKTIAMQASRTALEKNISDNEKLIAYTYRNAPETYEEFYPQGVFEYYQADLPTLETISERYKTVLANHSADFMPTFVTDYYTLQSTFKTNRAAQTTAKANVDSERSDLTTSRPAVAQQLTVNLLTISLQYLGDESKADVYFDQSILNAAFKESERKVDTTIDPGATQNIFDNIIKAELKLEGENKGTTELYIGFKATADEVCTSADTVAQPGALGTTTAGALGWTSVKKYLNITNPAGVTGSYMIEKV
jgi:hypothetical protein